MDPGVSRQHCGLSPGGSLGWASSTLGSNARRDVNRWSQVPSHSVACGVMHCLACAAWTVPLFFGGIFVSYSLLRFLHRVWCGCGLGFSRLILTLPNALRLLWDHNFALTEDMIATPRVLGVSCTHNVQIDPKQGPKTPGERGNRARKCIGFL